MKQNRNPKAAAWLGHGRDLLIVMMIGPVISFLFNPDLENFWQRLLYGSLYSLFVGGVLWKGNQYIGFTLGRGLDINHKPYRTLLWSLAAMFVFSFFVIVVINYIWFVVIFDWTPQRLFSSGKITMVTVFLVTIVIISIFYSISFFRSWRESAVNEERLQKESIRLQYQALKNQVNPHFLFNSLNSLTSLVYRDPDQAVKFIKQLSEVYRYVLEHKENELVPLADELTFSEKYVFLQKIRHGESLHVNFSVSRTKGWYVVPVSLQILIENAIKHNIVSEEDPLRIEVYDTESTIVIENNLQPKRTLTESGGIGLSSLRERYSFLSDRQVATLKTDNSFKVEIPLINQEENESADH